MSQLIGKSLGCLLVTTSICLLCTGAIDEPKLTSVSDRIMEEFTRYPDDIFHKEALEWGTASDRRINQSYLHGGVTMDASFLVQPVFSSHQCPLVSKINVSLNNCQNSCDAQMFCHHFIPCDALYGLSATTIYTVNVCLGNVHDTTCVEHAYGFQVLPWWMWPLGRCGKACPKVHGLSASLCN